MSRCSARALTPRNGHTLVVGIGARISGCANQKEISLDDQVDHGKEVAAELWDGPVDFRVIATKGKGEALDRPELAQIEQEYRKGQLDLFIFEDLGRLVRGAEATRLLGIGVDHHVRTIVPNDCIDTAEATWEEDALNACASHVAHNAHTSKRLKSKLMNRFRKFGGAPGRPTYGYIVPDEGVRSYDAWVIDPSATEPIQAGARRLLESATPNLSALADWFNAQGIPVGPYCRRKAWDGKMIGRLYRNPLLKGAPEQGNRHTVKNHQKGRRVSEVNPDGPISWSCPQLAHLDAATFDALQVHLREANERFRRKPVNGVDPRKRVSRQRTRFPGQWGVCWYCGSRHVWGGNGITEHLMCSGSREWKCWNAVSYDGKLAVKRVREALTAELYRLEGFDQQFRQLVDAAAAEVSDGRGEQRRKLEADAAALAERKKNVANALAEYGPSPLIKEKLAEVEAQSLIIARQRQELERASDGSLELPASTAALREQLEASFDDLAGDSYELGDLLRKLVPSFHVYLVRLCDGGHPLPRAKATLALDALVPDARYVGGLSPLLTRTVTLDLFIPPQRERIRQRAVALAAQGLGPKAIATRVVSEAQVAADDRPTATAVQNALALNRTMLQLGLDQPYVTLRSPPEDYGRLRRFKNSRFEFRAVEGHMPPSI